MLEIISIIVLTITANGYNVKTCMDDTGLSAKECGKVIFENRQPVDSSKLND